MPASYKYDVAFSFLSPDLTLAHDISDQLSVGLSTFVYDRKKEELLGGDGMDAFARVFGHDTRLTVILHRKGWAGTPWTAFEESHIKDRALKSRMRSFMVVTLDDEPLPDWVPDTHLYTSFGEEKVAGTVAVIRARARQEGSVVRPETAAEHILRAQREKDAVLSRRQHETSAAGLLELHTELQRVFESIKSSLGVVQAGGVSLATKFGMTDQLCVIASEGRSCSVEWVQPSSNTLRDARLRINDWAAHIRVPVNNGPFTTAGPWKSAIHCVPFYAAHGEWMWRRDPSLDDRNNDGFYRMMAAMNPEEFSTAQLADFILRRHFEIATEE